MASPSKDNAQLKRFKEAARNLEADEREEAFDAALKRIAKAPPQPKTKKPTRDDQKR